jgi:hypothetical protein
MADRRPEDSGSATRGQDDLTQRISAAYSSSGPTPSGTSPSTGGAPGATAAKPRGRERFAAALSRSDSTTKSERTAKDQETGQGKAPGKSASKRVRKAHLRITHVDPWSVMKTSFLFSVALGIVVVVAVAVVWSVLGAAGIWDSIDATVADVVGQTGESFRVEDYLGMSRVMGFTMIVAVVDVILVTVIGTLGAFLYNLAAALLGGVEVVLAEDER